MEGDETYKSIADNILEKGNIKNYKRYIDDIYIEKYFEKLVCKEEEEEDDFEIKIFKKICFHPPCMNEIICDNYCNIHNKDMI